MAGKIRLGIVIGMFHKDIAEAMLSRMEAKATKLDADIIETFKIPGSYEAPIATKKLLERADIDCVVVSGFIEKGSTLHGEHMGLVVSGLLKNLELHYNKPVGMGIIGPGANRGASMRKTGLRSSGCRSCGQYGQVFERIEVMLNLLVTEAYNHHRQL